MPDVLPPAWIKTALSVTGSFEDSADPLGAVSGDFDGMGISLGVLQWNIGSGSLQPLIKAIGRAAIVGTMPHYGIDLWNACNAPISSGLSIVRAWQNGATLKPAVMGELKLLTHSDAFVTEEIATAEHTASIAFDHAQAYAASVTAGATASLDLFCWFFDVYTQNGGLGTLSFADVQQFTAANGQAKVDDVICDWLAARTVADSGYRDSLKNAKLWRGTVLDAATNLFVLSYLRSLQARHQYRADVLNRKATIAIGEGWVHGEYHDLQNLLS